MYTYKRDGNVYYLTEWRLCCQCYRMFALNHHSYVVGYCDGVRLWQHLTCPKEKHHGSFEEKAPRLAPPKA